MSSVQCLSLYNLLNKYINFIFTKIYLLDESQDLKIKFIYKTGKVTKHHFSNSIIAT